ncbi:MAG: RecX family transcriptional regulator [Acidobacteriota bacterium]
MRVDDPGDTTPESEGADDGLDACMEKAVELLARRAHFRRELRRKLRTRGFDELDVDTTLDRLSEQGHLDDRATAEFYVAGRLRRGGFGPRRLEAELMERGVDGDEARAVVTAAVGDEAALAGAAADRWLRTNGRRATPQALGRHLERAGFRTGLVIEHVRRLQAELREDEVRAEGDPEAEAWDP